MGSLQALQLLTTAARLAKEEYESVSKAEITKKLEDIKYLSSQKKVPRLSLRKEIIHLENQLHGVLELDERFARQKNKESIAVASLKQQITVLKNKLRAVEDLELEKKVEHLSFLLGEHLARKEIAGEVATLTEITPVKELSTSREQTLVEESEVEESSQLSLETVQKITLLQKRLDALKHELDIHHALETKKPDDMELIEEKIKLLEEKLQQYYERYQEALQHEAETAEADFEVKHKLLFPQTKKSEEAEVSEEVRTVEKMLPLPPPPRMQRK